HGDLPGRTRLADFRQRLAAAARLPQTLLDLLRVLPPGTSPMDVVRTSVSVLAHYDPETDDNSPPAEVRKAERLLAQIPVAVAARHRLSQGLEPVPARPGLGDAANFLYMLRGREARPDDARAL